MNSETHGTPPMRRGGGTGQEGALLERIKWRGRRPGRCAAASRRVPVGCSCGRRLLLRLELRRVLHHALHRRLHVGVQAAHQRGKPLRLGVLDGVQRLCEGGRGEAVSYRLKMAQRDAAPQASPAGRPRAALRRTALNYRLNSPNHPCSVPPPKAAPKPHPGRAPAKKMKGSTASMGLLTSSSSSSLQYSSSAAGEVRGAARGAQRGGGGALAAGSWIAQRAPRDPGAAPPSPAQQRGSTEQRKCGKKCGRSQSSSSSSSSSAAARLAAARVSRLCRVGVGAARAGGCGVCAARARARARVPACGGQSSTERDAQPEEINVQKAHLRYASSTSSSSSLSSDASLSSSRSAGWAHTSGSWKAGSEGGCRWCPGSAAPSCWLRRTVQQQGSRGRSAPWAASPQACPQPPPPRT